MNLPVYTNQEDIVVKISFIFKMFFLLIFTLEFLYMMSIKTFTDILGKKFIIINVILGVLAYLISFLLIKYISTHYYLYMYLISVQIFAIILLSLTIRIKRSNKEIH